MGLGLSNSPSTSVNFQACLFPSSASLSGLSSLYTKISEGRKGRIFHIATDHRARVSCGSK